ncbi:MAG: hypothetical protein COA74_01190 [Gammaproteobacteria bacterium]|nr:MAG: hypothetical protein COA74_01190 [Gammaproteobacteria bacterium]
MSEANLKERIVEATLTELKIVEVAQISLRKISKQLDVTAQAPYHYFPNKDALLLEIKIRALQGLNSRWKNINEQEDDLLKRLENLSLSYANYFYNNVGYYKVMKHKMKLGDEFKAEIKRSRDTFISAAEDIVAFYNIKDLTGENLTLLCWSSIHGLIDLQLQNMIVIDSLKTKEIAVGHLSDTLVKTISVLVKSMTSRETNV